MNKIYKALIILSMIMGIGVSYNQIHAATYHGVPNVKFEPDATGRYGPVSDNGKGPAIDTDGKRGISKSEAEKLNNGETTSTTPSNAKHKAYSTINNNPSLNQDNTKPKTNHTDKHTVTHHTKTIKKPATKHNKSLTVIHAGLIWTGIVLIGAIVIYCLVNNHKSKRFN